VANGLETEKEFNISTRGGIRAIQVHPDFTVSVEMGPALEPTPALTARIHLATGEVHRFSKSECRFGYRESIFKNEVKGEYVITHVTFRLNKQPNFTTSYGAIAQELERMQVATLSLRAVADAVIAIRQSKLPDPRVLGNAGSFFKNPVVSTSFFERFSAEWPDAPHYPAADGIKLAAGWLIERAGWKGYRTNGCGVHDRQALVLVNFGGASGQEIYDLSTLIVNDVEQRFGVTLEREVNIL
jgi:UDP-N-acetylmuramate dehydrogenase